MSRHDASAARRAERNDVVTPAASVGAENREVVKVPRLGGTAECSHVPGASRVIFVFETNFGGNVTIGFLAAAREDSLRLHACACTSRNASASASASTRSARTHVRIRVCASRGFGVEG